MANPVEPVDQLRTDVTNTLTQMRTDFTNEITKLKSELDKVSAGGLDYRIQDAITKIVQSRVEPLEKAVMKMQTDSSVRSLRDEAVIEKTSFGRPFVYKGVTA